jgi:hypothetical protein
MARPSAPKDLGEPSAAPRCRCVLSAPSYQAVDNRMTP